MTAAAPLPGAGAVPRVTCGTRGAAGRRAVRVGLLVGGLFALGVLWGARASAADEGAPGVSSLPAAVTAAGTTTGTDRVVRPVGESTARPVTEADTPSIEGTAALTERPVPLTERPVPLTERPVPLTERIARPVMADVAQPVTDPVLRPVTEHAVQPVAERFAQPATEHVVRQIADDLVQPGVEAVVRPVVDDVVQPVVPPVLRPVTEGPSAVPSLPTVPGLPEPSGWTTSPVEAPPADVTPREPGRAVAGNPGSTVDGDGGSGSGGERDSVPPSVAFGPTGVVSGSVIVSAPRRDAGVGDAPVVRGPAHRSPGGLPTGSLGRHSAVDNGGPRHVEASTVASLGRAPLSVVPGAPAADVPDGVRDRDRDIPEFPG
ncbi:hypothetical protein [Streptomyces stelliscabiei]|uniref:hypothetical protein n=1 Tax=Streptomyces stelliscabiei TaxID=146820 RepID=UPI002FEF601F